MAYSTGTIALTNGSTTVTGTGTSWVNTLREGWLLIIPGEGALLVSAVASNTSLTLARAYQGTTRSGQVYDAIPTQGEITPFVTQIQTLLATVQSVIDYAGQGRFAAGSAAAPSVRGSADADTGWNFLGSNQLEAVIGGAQRLLMTTSQITLASMLLAFNGGGASTSYIRRQGGSRHELTFTAAGTTSYSTGSRGAAMAMYGNLDPEHPGVWTASTGTDDNVTARIYIARDGTVVMGKDIWDYGDAINDGSVSPMARLMLKDTLGLGGDLANLFAHKRYQSTGGTAVTLPPMFGGVGMEEGSQDLGQGDGARFGFFVMPYTTTTFLEKGWWGFVKGTPTEEEWAHDYVIALAPAQTRESVPTELLRLRAIERDLQINGHRAVTLGNTLGTVSQSGGTPTGAIVETGSNANGRYTRFADGTQICWQSQSITPIANTPTSGAWTFPAAFAGSASDIAILVTQNSTVPGSTVQEVSFGNATTTGCDLYVYRTNTTSTNLRAMAIGRWF